MSGTGDVVKNPVTEERMEIRLGTEESSRELSVAEVFARPGGAVARARTILRVGDYQCGFTPGTPGDDDPARQQPGGTGG